MNSGSYFLQAHEERASPELRRNFQGTAANVGEKANLASVVLVPSTETDDSLCGESSYPSPCPVWQVQYYSETLEPSSSVSLLAQTKQEEDDRFYATFPQARIRHWAPQYSEFFGDTAFYLGAHDYGYTSCPPPATYNHGSLHIEPSATSALTPAITSVSSELMAAINLCGGKSAAQIDSNPCQPTFVSSGCGGNPRELPFPAKVVPSNVPLPKSASQPLKVDIESVNQMKMYSGSEPLMDFLSPPCAEAEASLSQVPLDFNHTTKDQTVPSPTGTWPRMRIRSIQSPSGTVNSESPTLKLECAPSPAPTIIPLAAPSPPEEEKFTRAGETAPMGLMRISPLPANRRPIEKKKVSGMACNFCRKRKIACGPPLAGLDGTVEKTCNQCQRRSRECVFPTENRRGLRKKKAS